VRVSCVGQWEDETMRERTGHLLSYAVVSSLPSCSSLQSWAWATYLCLGDELLWLSLGVSLLLPAASVP